MLSIVTSFPSNQISSLSISGDNRGLNQNVFLLALLDTPTYKNLSCLNFGRRQTKSFHDGGAGILEKGKMRGVKIRFGNKG